MSIRKEKLEGGSISSEQTAADRGIEAVLALEKRGQNSRSSIDQLSTWITAKAGSGTAIVIHVAWFTAWLIVNSGYFGITPFDPFPFNFLTMGVSLEAIFLTLFVLVSQNRMSQEADKRARLDLQVNILAERESTLILQLLENISLHLGIKLSSENDIKDLSKNTRIDELAAKLDKSIPPQ